MSTILVIDTDRTVLQFVEKVLQEAGRVLHTANNAIQGLAAIRNHSPDLLLWDTPKISTSSAELEFIGTARNIDPNLPIIVMTCSDDSHTVIEVMKHGAYDYLMKPLNIDNLRRQVQRALETRRLLGTPGILAGLESDFMESAAKGDVFLGRSPPMLEVYKEIGRIARPDVAVLICGESGTGKELVARAINHHSPRCNRHFLAVNCAAISETLLDSELFGHEKGAFTGADRQRIGKFEQSNGGTIFLDEVGDMSSATQSKVLRALEEKKFERVGGTETISTDVRVISATNRDLKRMMKDGSFRADLYHRLHGYRIDLPPLREHSEDIPVLIGYLLAKFRRELGKDIQGISPEAMEILTRHSWPGNVRELQTVLRTAILRSAGPVLMPDSLPEEVKPDLAPYEISGSDDLPDNLANFINEREKAGSEDLYAETLQMMERYIISRMLRETKCNQSLAAKRLGITRGSLRNKMYASKISIKEIMQPNITRVLTP
jgi:DNA-binding NtrC family response regulator